MYIQKHSVYTYSEDIMNDAVINIRTDKEIKEQANRIFEDMGLNTSAAINLFLKQTVLKRRLPFDIESNVITVELKTSSLIHYHKNTKNIILKNK